ncbi:MAG: hypothetical protein IPG70_05660 [Moraxellaceae bacterium]|nr:hypothetical protein [Moraxellaceae bacterium]
MAYWWARLKPKSAVWRTTLVIGIVVLVSQYLSLAFFGGIYTCPKCANTRITQRLILSLLRNAEKRRITKSSSPRNASMG